jgi:hypothetical protein
LRAVPVNQECQDDASDGYQVGEYSGGERHDEEI